MKVFWPELVDGISMGIQISSVWVETDFVSVLAVEIGSISVGLFERYFTEADVVLVAAMYCSAARTAWTLAISWQVP